MSEPIEQLQRWLDSLGESLPAQWALMPDIGLYMDQVQTYIDRQLGLYRYDDQDRLLTPAMINNYIKDDLIPRAEAKKYSPVHLALLIIIATLKQVLSMQDLNRLLSVYRDKEAVARLYAQFLDVQSRCLRDNVSHSQEELRQMRQAVEQAEVDEAATAESHEAALRELALELCIEARTKILIAEKILAVLPSSQREEDSSQRPKNNNRKKEKPQS